jgi:zinc protease
MMIAANGGTRGCARDMSLLVALTLGLLASLGAQGPDRTAPPQLGPPPSLRLPPIERRMLSNGLPVWVVEQHKVPVVAVTLLVRSGSSADPAGRFGVATLTAAMLDEGAGSRSSLEIADEIDYLGASLSTGSSFDASVVRLQVPVARLQAALPIMADVALRPVFPDKDLERLRQERLTTLLQARNNPSTLVSIAFPRIVYGSAHRYGTAAFGTAESVRALTTAELRAFHAEHYRPDNAALIVAGDVTASRVLPQLESALGGWRPDKSAAVAPVLPDPAPLKARQVFLVDTPGAAQSQIRIGSVGVSRSTPDYFALEVLNTILGGSFSSRLNQNLREQHGYTYGAGSSFDMRRSAGPFFAAASVQTDKTAEALREFFNELNGILKPPPPDEVERARNLIALGFPSQFETTGDLSRRLEELFVYDLPPDYFSTYVQRIQAVRPEDVQRAAQKYIRPDRLAAVIVGDASNVRASIEALKLGTVTMMTVADVLGPATR